MRQATSKYHAEFTMIIIVFNYCRYLCVDSFHTTLFRKSKDRVYGKWKYRVYFSQLESYSRWKYNKKKQKHLGDDI